MPLGVTLAQVATRSGYGPGDPIVIGVRRRENRPAYLTRGCLPPVPGAEGRAGPTRNTLIYVASLAKQVTAACVALAGLDPESPIADHVPGLPEWARPIRLRHLLHHTGGLPGESDLPDGEERTTAGLLAALRNSPSDAAPSDAAPADAAPSDASPAGTSSAVALPDALPSDASPAGTSSALDPSTALPTPPAPVSARSSAIHKGPGAEFAYSNVGYVLLAEAVARAVGESLAGFARRRVFGPLGMTDTVFWDGPAPAPDGAVPLDPMHPSPLSIGDGGMWSTAADLLRWAVGLDDDRLGITGVLQTPGWLDDGTELDYAWGMGVREFAGRRVYRHGGSFADVRAVLVRVPEEGFDLVVLAPGDHTERCVGLADRLLDALLKHDG